MLPPLQRPGHLPWACLRPVLALAIAAAVPRSTRAEPIADPSVELIHFTDDLSEQGSPLLPGFLNHSCWSGIGATGEGIILIAVSNHVHSAGNAALYMFDPVRRRMNPLGDLRSISSEVANWMPGESQHKVHTFLLQHADGQVYFATDDYEPSEFVRGAHLYRIDPQSGRAEDVSKSLPKLMTRELELIPNSGSMSAQSGVMFEYFGIKGIGLNPAQPELIYSMTHQEGHLVRTHLGTGDMSVVGVSPQVDYVFHVSGRGDVYYGGGSATTPKLLKYVAATGATQTIADPIPEGGFGACAPAADGVLVYFLMAGSKAVHVLDTDSDTFTHVGNLCGPNWWLLFNLSLSPDGRNLYFVSNNNDRKAVRRFDLQSGSCVEVMRIDGLIGTRNLCFGGVSVWDRQGCFYVPVWTHLADPPDLALLRVRVEPPEAPGD